jgi:predicted metal-dependent enzyme (double-stranded beta helix superfamily)
MSIASINGGAMAGDAYPIAQLVADLEAVCAKFDNDHDIIAAVRPLAHRAALARDSWFRDDMYRTDAGQGYGVHLLHEKPDHTLAVFAVSWLPDRGAPPHDHGTWAVVVGVEGDERNNFYERTDDRSRPGHADLRKIGEKTFGIGDVVGMPKGMIHSVWNDTGTVSVSLHIYGMHFNHTDRSQFDIERKLETPFKVRIEA